MCRNIRTLFNFEPPATEQEIRDASLQFVRKLSGFTAPSKANEAAFQRAVEEVAAAEALGAAAAWAAPAGDASEAAATNTGPSADRPQTKIFNIYIFYNSVS